jgi:hypothetical protein
MTFDWKQRLESKMGEREEAELRQATYSGLPFGDRSFVAQLEQRLTTRKGDVLFARRDEPESVLSPWDPWSMRN